MRMLYVGVAATLAVGCVSTQATVLDTSYRPRAICPEGVKVYLSAEAVGAPYTEVALLQSSGDDDMTSASGMISSQRKKAAELGANGIVLSAQKDASSGAKIAQALFGTSANRKGEAVAIHVPSDSVRVQDICRTEAAS